MIYEFTITEISVHDAPIPVFTRGRSGHSRCAETRTQAHFGQTLVDKLAPLSATRLDAPWP